MACVRGPLGAPVATYGEEDKRKGPLLALEAAPRWCAPNKSRIAGRHYDANAKGRAGWYLGEHAFSPGTGPRPHLR